MLVAIVYKIRYKPGYRSCDLLKNSSALIGGKFIFQKKSFTRFALQSECCNFNQWEEWIYNRSHDLQPSLYLNLIDDNHRYALLETYFFTLFNGFLSEISYFRIFWPQGGSTAVKKLCRVFKKCSITILIICLYFWGAYFGC